MMTVNKELLAANKLRTISNLDFVCSEPYIICGGGSYVKDILEIIIRQGLRLPDFVLGDLDPLSIPVDVIKDDNQSILSAKRILLGTGAYQLEMIRRLTARCALGTTFFDVLLHANTNVSTLPRPPYILYVDLYAETNIKAYLEAFFRRLKRAGIEVVISHPLENISESLLNNAIATMIWNGSTAAFLPILERLRGNKNVFYSECGFFPQHEHFYLDKKGVNLKSQLACDTLDWVKGEHMEALAELSENWQKEVSPYSDTSDYIFVPLQVPTDSNIQNHSSFKDGMQSFIDYIESLYPDKNILIKTHPKDTNAGMYRSRFAKFVDSDTRSLIAGADHIHGINSSVLYEAVLMGRSVSIEGECLLKSHINQVDKLLAAMIYRQYRVMDPTFVLDKLSRFSYLPIQELQCQLSQ